MLAFGALRRKPLTTTTYGLDGTALAAQPYSVTTHSYDTLIVASTLDASNKVVVPFCKSSTEQRWERESTLVSTREVEYSAVTTEGDVLQQRTYAQRTGAATPDQDVTTTTTQATGGTNLRLPARVTQTAADGSIVSEVVFYYDGDPFVGLPEGEATQGLITRTEDRAFDDSFVSSLWGASPPDLTQFGYHRLAGDSTGWWRTRRAHQRQDGSVGKGPRLITRGSLGAVQTLQYDPSGQYVIQVMDAAGNTASATINQRAFQTQSITNANGKTTSDVFDPLGRVTATVGPLDTVSLPSTTFSYTPAAVSTIVASARVTHGGTEMVPATTWIDGAGRALGKATPAATAGQRILTGAVLRNTRGLVSTAYLPYIVTGTDWQPPPADTASATSNFDALGRVVQTTRTDGLVVTTRREAGTLTISETWPGGQTVDVERQIHDAAGQLISVSRNAGNHWVEQRYSYAACGKVNAVTLPGGSQVTFTLDLFGRIFAQQSPDTGRTLFLIDACDNQRERTNAAGQIVRTDVDAMNRITAVYHDRETTPRIRYDFLDQGGMAPADGITANRHTRPWRVADEIGTVVFEYDDAGRAISTTRTIAATGQTIGNTAAFDALGRTTSVTLPSATGAPGRTVAYSYRADGRLGAASGVVSAAEYDLYGRLTSFTYENGARTLLDYADSAGALQRVRVLDASSNVLRDVTATRSNGLLQSLVSATVKDDSVVYGYDEMQRLAGATYGQGATTADDHQWTFDDSTNLTMSSDSGALTYTAGTHQVAAVGGAGIVFDAAGRMTTGRYGTGVFDGADHLTSVTLPDATLTSHTYDYRGQRALSTTGGTQTYSCPTDNIEFFDGSAVIWIRFGHQRVAADIGGELSFIHPNALGVFDLITDAAGAYVSRVRQTPFGFARPATGLASTGSAATLASIIAGNDATGLILQGVRWYDPVLAQFISPDPVVSSVYTIGAWNPYVFCLGNPILLADPTGASVVSVLEVVGLAILAAACVVAAIYTGGASLAALGVITENIGGLLMAGVAVGSFGGALAGELAAQKAGGSLWAGAFVGALLGGATSLAGGALGGAAADGMDVAATFASGAEGPLTHTFWSFVAAGGIQGTLAGAGTGLAVGFAGGKGSAEGAIKAMAKGAAWGAALGTLLGASLGGTLGTTNIFGAEHDPENYLVLSPLAKWADSSQPVPSMANVAGSTVSSAQLAAGDASGLFGLLPITTSSEPGLLSAPIGWLAPATLQDAGFAAGVDASMALDQAGFSYAHQLSYLIGAAPYFIDVAAAVWQIVHSSGYDSTEVSFNNAFGSASPNNTG